MAIGSLARGSLRAYCSALGELISAIVVSLGRCHGGTVTSVVANGNHPVGVSVVLVRRYRELRRDRRTAQTVALKLRPVHRLGNCLTFGLIFAFFFHLT